MTARAAKRNRTPVWWRRLSGWSHLFFGRGCAGRM